MTEKNNDIKRERFCYELLSEVLIRGGYANIVLGEKLGGAPASDRAYITNLFYGVLEKSVQFDYIIARLTQKKPQAAVTVLLKLGLYLLRYAGVPSYAAVDKTVDLAKSVGKTGVAGFINAVLKKSADVKLSEIKDVSLSMSVIYSCPLWITRRFIEEYGENFTRRMLECELPKKTHLRRNALKPTSEPTDELLKECEPSQLGYYAGGETANKLAECGFIKQSLASMFAVKAYASFIDDGDRVIDLCAAPGGKAVYLYELTGADITACDLHPHRVTLTRKYAAAAGAPLKCIVGDATIFKPEWEGVFDAVICDVPCSGLGVMKNKPDIPLKLRAEDIGALTRLQSAILAVAARYVKPGGILFYSTCTVLKEENEQIVENFIAESDFIAAPLSGGSRVGADGAVHLFPHIDGTDGFFVAAARRRE